VSCLAEQAKILFAEAEENNLGAKALQARWDRWSTCSLCEQYYHGVVYCALSWACWKTYVGRPEGDQARRLAINQLGAGLHNAGHHADALSVKEAELAMERRLGAPEGSILATQGNLANTYEMLGRDEEAMLLRRDVYSGFLRINGMEHQNTLRAANNYAATLTDLKRFEEIKSLMRRQIPVARRVLGGNDEITLRMRWNYVVALYKDASATLDDLCEAVETLEEMERTARRVLGGAHPTATGIESTLRKARAALRARETPPPGSA
jgi:hypothetical protein